MSIQDIIQSEIQKAAAKKKQEAAASTVATQKGSTTAPTVTETPKVTSTPKAVQSVTTPTQTTPATSQIQTRQQQAKTQRQEELQQPTEPNLFQKAKTALVGDIKGSDVVDFFTAPAKDVLKSFGETDIAQTAKLAQQSVKEGKTTVKDLFKQGAQSTYYGMLSYGTQFDKWLAGEALYRLQKVNPRMYEEFKKVGITEEAINNMFNDMQTYFDTQTKGGKRVTKLQEGGISLADVLAHGDVQSAIDLIGNQGGQMLPIIAGGVAGGGLGAFGMSFPVMAQESIDDYMNDPSITMNVSDGAIRNAALGAGALKAAIESLDTMFEFFGFGKGVPVKKGVMESLIKHKFASMGTEALEEMAQYEIDEIVAKLLGSDRDWTSFGELVKDVGFEAALYSLFFPTGTVKGINQKSINKMYEEIENKIREDIPDATPEQVQEIAKNIVERIFSEEKEEEKEETEEERLLSEALTLTQERTDTNNQLTELRENNGDIEEISDLELKLKDIETKLQDIDTKIGDIQQQQTNEEELPAQPKEEQQLPKEEGGENLSEQTMSTIQRSQADVNRIMDSIGPKNKKIMNAKIKNEDKARYYQLINNLAKSTPERAMKELENYSYDSLLFMLKDLENTDGREAYLALGQVERTINDKLKKIWKTNIVKGEVKKGNVTIKDFKDIEDLEKMGITLDRALMIRDFGLMTTENEKDLWGLKGVKIKDLEGKITDKVARKYGLLIAKAADRLGIDWNKVIDGMEFSLVTAEGKEVSNDLVGTLGFNFPLFSKETIKEYLNKNPGDENLFKEGFVEAQQDLTKSVISLLIKGDDVKAERVLAHELIHLMELKYGVDNNLNIVRQGDYRGFAGILNGRTDFNTFNTEDADGKNQIPDGDDYFYRDSEVWARYNEQYEAYRRFLDATNKEELTAEDQKIVNDYIKLTESAGYWTQEEFDKLIDERDRIINEAFADYLLDEENKGYSDIMYKINDDLKWLSTQQELSLDNAHYKYVTLKREYQMIEEQIKNLSGDIKEEVRKGYDLALSLLESNYAMLVNNPKEYDKVTTNTKSQQTQIDNMVNYIPDNIGEIEESISDINEGNSIISKSVDVNEIEENKSEPLDKQVHKTINKVEKSVDKMVKDKEKKERIKGVGNGIKNVFTPALSRLYNISPRLAGAVHTYEARKELQTLLYKKKTLEFAKALDKLKKKSPEKYKKLSLALFDYGMVDDIDIKEALKEAGIDPEIFNDVAVTLQQIAQRYKDAGLDITINDKYFPRKVKDYGLLLDYLSRKTGTDIKDKRKSLLNYIEEVNNDPNLSEGEKEQKIHSKLINEFTKPSERSNNAKERKLVLSEWLLTEEEKKQGYVNDITDFYEDPIKSLEMYIDDMVKKTELKKMLGGLTDSGKAISEDFETSVSGILMDMVDRGELTKDKADEAAYTIKSIINVKPSGDLISMIKNATYSLTIANYLSAAQQLEDISKTLLKGPTGFKNVIKAIIGKAGIKMDDTGLTNAFAQLDKGGITEFNFKFSGFNMVDALGKNSFLNTAYDSCRKQANSKKRWKLLYHRLTSMYGQEMGEKMFNDYKEGKLKDGEVFNMDLMADLLYQLGSTQPVYQSAMPTAYLNNPGVRIFYCLYSFSIKQVDWLIQGTKEVYNNQLILGHSKSTAATVATMWCIRATIVIALISSMVTDLINTIKGDEEETVLWKLLNEGWEEALKQLGWNSFYGALRIFSLSRYDRDIFKREGIEGVLMNKLSPASLSILNDFVKIGLGKKDVDDLGKYGPLFIKPLYYIFKNKGMLPEYRLPRGDKKKDGKDEWGWEDNEEWNWEGGDEWEWKDEEEWNW